MRISDWSSDWCSSDLIAVSCKPVFGWRRVMVIGALRWMLLIAVLSVSAVTPLHAEGVVDPTPELYRVSTLRAAPGALLDVLALYADAADAGPWQGLDEEAAMLLPHAQAEPGGGSEEWREGQGGS